MLSHTSIAAKPDFTRSCSYCKQKKVKCPGELPTCSRCKKAHVDCNIIDEVGYSYKTVQSLLDRISELENQLDLAQSNHGKRFNANEQPSNPKGRGQALDHHRDNNQVIDNISTEVGSLTISNSPDEGKYIGAATGSAFARVFLKQINLSHLEAVDTLNNDLELFDAMISKTCASLPHHRVAKYVLSKYIDKIQIYFPIFIIPHLKRLFEMIYQDSSRVSYFDKFLVFMVLAVGSLQTVDEFKDARLHNPFKPVEYYNTALRYFENILTRRSEKSLQALILMIIWMLESSALQDDNGDLWHLSRFCMSLAMELGVHRYNPVWNFGETKNELRNRLFWTTYIIDRTVAMKFGRGLSLRNQAIDTPLPKLLNDDYLTPSDDTTIMFNYNQVQFVPCIMLTKICRIGGDMLESIYISRTVGAAPILSNEEVIEMKRNQQNSLNDWMNLVEHEIPKSTTCFYELKARFCMHSIILNRPSPSFPVPDTRDIILCKTHCIECVNCYTELLRIGWRITPACLHDLVNAGLTMIYCSWRVDSNSQHIELFSNNILKIMEEACKILPKFIKFKNLFNLVSSAIVEHINSTHTSTMALKPDTFESDLEEPNRGATSEILGLQFEWNDLFSQEAFQNSFRNYYDLGNDRILSDLGEHFNDFGNTMNR